MSRPCCDRHHRLQSPSRDGSRGSLSPKIGDFRDDENSRTTRSKGGLSAWRDKPRLAGLRRAVARRRYRPATYECLRRRASPHRETASPEPPFAPLTGIAAASLSPTPNRTAPPGDGPGCLRWRAAGLRLPRSRSRGSRDPHRIAAARLLHGKSVDFRAASAGRWRPRAVAHGAAVRIRGLPPVALATRGPAARSRRAPTAEDPRRVASGL